ncbi:MAG: protein kinase [Planctomycetota bacterium]
MTTIDCPTCGSAVSVTNVGDGAALICPVCSREFVPQKPPADPAAGGEPDALLLPGAQIGGCVIEELIGKGGMGQVYRAKQQRLNRVVAIKAISNRLASSESKYVERFLNEARAGASIDHPNVVHIYDVGDENGILYILSVYVTGRTLKDVIGGQPMPLVWTLDIMEQALRGLSAVHLAELLHRDIKPQNFMISDEGNVKLMDFGLAKPVTGASDLTTAGFVMGTPSYMSPEQCEGDPLDHRTDIYSLGLVFWTMLTGNKPFVAENNLATMKLQREAPLPDVTSILPNIPKAIDAIIQKMSAKRAADRYYSADQVIEDIQAFIAHRPLKYALVPADTNVEQEVPAPQKPANDEPVSTQAAPPADAMQESSSEVNEPDADPKPQGYIQHFRTGDGRGTRILPPTTPPAAASGNLPIMTTARSQPVILFDNRPVAAAESSVSSQPSAKPDADDEKRVGDTTTASGRQSQIKRERTHIDEKWRDAVRQGLKKRGETGIVDATIGLARRKTAGDRQVIVECRFCHAQFKASGLELGTVQPCPKCNEMTPYSPPSLISKPKRDRKTIRLFLFFILSIIAAYSGIRYGFRTNVEPQSTREVKLRERLQLYYLARQNKDFGKAFEFEEISVDLPPQSEIASEYARINERQWRMTDIKTAPEYVYRLEDNDSKAIVKGSYLCGRNFETDHELCRKEPIEDIWLWLAGESNWYRRASATERESYCPAAPPVVD